MGDGGRPGVGGGRRQRRPWRVEEVAPQRRRGGAERIARTATAPRARPCRARPDSRETCRSAAEGRGRARLRRAPHAPRPRLRARARAPTRACREASSSESAAAALRIVAASQAARSAPGPPWRTVSAAPTTSMRSVSTSAGWMRTAVRLSATSASSSASWTTTRPRNARACGGGSSALEVALAEAASEPTRDEDRLALVRDPAALELRDRHGDRRLPGVLRRAG